MERGVLVFWSNSSPLGLENTLNLIKYPFLGFEKPQFGAKFVVKIPRLVGTRKEVFKCPYPPPNLSTCKICDEYS